MMIKSFIALLIITFPSLVFAQERLLDRKYKLGDSYQYKLTCTEYHNGKWESTVVSVCKLSVGRDSNGVYFDEIHWVSKKIFSQKDTIDQTDKAILVKPYHISLQKNGKLDLPKIEIPAMTEPIQDFNTFFVAISPQLGTTELKSAGDSISKKDLVKADFSNGDFISKGDDCFSIKLKMTGVTRKTVMTEVDFLPPQEICFPYLLDEMKIPVIDNTTNNFQMVQPTGNQKFNVQYGREIFYIYSITARNGGKLLSATMNNTLNLKLKINCDKDYKNSQTDIPFTIQRDLKLELL
jgi:hypothetical protein